jgi:hypothetical protein
MNVRGVSLNYKIIGNQGPWMVLSPGGHRSMAHVVNGREKMCQIAAQ